MPSIPVTLVLTFATLLTFAHSQKPNKGGGGGGGGGNSCDASLDLSACTAAGTSSCANNLYVSFAGMVYDNATGKFTGNVITNQCRYYNNQDDVRHKPDCCGEKVGPGIQDKFPSRGRVAWSIKGELLTYILIIIIIIIHLSSSHFFSVAAITIAKVKTSTVRLKPDLALRA